MHFYSSYPGRDLALDAARFISERTGDQLADAVVLLPTRRASQALRDAFRRLNAGNTVLLPRMVSLADVGSELLTLVGHEALSILQSIPPAMPSAQRRYLLAAQVMKFQELSGRDSGLQPSMRLADYLADLQDRCTRAGITLTPEKLAQLFPGDYAMHWQQALQFLDIVAQAWPAIEQVYGQITPAAHEAQLLQALNAAWEKTPPPFPVFAVGSTASQPATAALLSTIAAMEQGAVILPGLDPRLREEAWDAVHESHPYFHLKQLLDRNGRRARDVEPLGDAPAHCSIWLEALCRVEAMEQWQHTPLDPAGWAHIRMVACQHAEEEARSIALIMREGLESPSKQVALITPDESLMARVAAHLKQFGLVANRTSAGSLATTEAGSVVVALLQAMRDPQSLRALVQLLRHPLVGLGAPDAWPGWLDAFEHRARGVATHGIGQLPKLPDMLLQTEAAGAVHALVQRLAEGARARLAASAWVTRINALLGSLQPQTGQGHDTVQEALLQCASADVLGRLIDIDDFAVLAEEALAAAWRGPQFDAHPQLTMLTPVEARLQHFDRVILGNMQERLWPGIHGQSPWLNLAQQAQLGLPSVEQHSTLLAHDVLMLGSCAELFLTYPQREAGSPVARSRYLERLVTLLTAQRVAPSEIHQPVYHRWALQAHSSSEFAPEPAPRPTPAERPASLRVTWLDVLFSDPYSLYARAILGLRPLDPLDGEPDPRDLGTIAHALIQQLGEHWTAYHAAPDATMLETMVDAALADFADRAAIQLFWRQRLLRALQFVNAQEQVRRLDAVVVRSELDIVQDVALPTGALTLHGRIDRLEGEAIIDYKTGKPPRAKDITEGRAVQLLAYALLLAERGDAVAALEYWGLPAGKRAGSVEALAWDDALAADLTGRLRAALAELMDPATPLLARPVPGGERFDNDYDGISRYDEWAG